MLIFALMVLSACAVLFVAQSARAQTAAPIRLDIRLRDHADTSGGVVGNGSWTSDGPGYRNC